MRINLNENNRYLFGTKKAYIAPECYVENIVDEMEMLAATQNDAEVSNTEGEGNNDNVFGGDNDKLSKRNIIWFSIDSYSEDD